MDVKPRRSIAVDEACVKANGLEYYVLLAVDIDRNEIVCMRVYPLRNMLQQNLKLPRPRAVIGEQQ